MKKSWLPIAIGLLPALGWMEGATAQPAPSRICRPAPDSTGRARLADVFIDGKRVARDVPVTLENVDPESYSLDEPEPDAIRTLPPERIDLIEFRRGGEAERDYGLCSGYLAVLITIKPS